MAEQFEVIMYAFGDNLEVATCHSVVCTPAAVSLSLFMILLVMCISLENGGIRKGVKVFDFNEGS